VSLKLIDNAKRVQKYKSTLSVVCETGGYCAAVIGGGKQVFCGPVATEALMLTGWEYKYIVVLLEGD